MTKMAFDDLVDTVQACRRCERMDDCTRVLSWANGNVVAPLMFVGEAPGRLGADRTAIPFHGDKSGNNFELLLSSAGLSRRDIFVTNAVLCNPRNSEGNNVPPSKDEIKNCAEHLRRQIETIQPRMVMTLGSVALEATRLIESHDLELRRDVRTSRVWNGRLLLPLYHPGARAMIHRSFANQTADYYFIGETYRRLNVPRKERVDRKSDDQSWLTLGVVMERLREFSLFRLHKVMYLLDWRAISQHGRPLTSFFYIRQKDGPYCVDLGGNWYNRFSNLHVFKGAIPRFAWGNAGLFDAPSEANTSLLEAVDAVCSEINSLSDAELKTKVYLTQPMRRLLAIEKTGRSTLNHPLLVS